MGVRVDAEHRHRRDQQSQPIGRRCLQGRQRDLAAGPGAVLDHHRFRDHLAQFIGDAACRHVDSATRREAGEYFCAVRQALGTCAGQREAAGGGGGKQAAALDVHVSVACWVDEEGGPRKLPGFIRLCGSSARLTACILPSAPEPRSRSH